MYVRVAADAGEALSVMRTAKVYVPPLVGVPLIMPDAAFSCSPGGSLPELTDQAYGGWPPFAVSVAEWDFPLWPSRSDVVTIEIGAAATDMLNAFVADAAGDALSVTRALNEWVPAVVGVPEMSPVPAASARPGDRLPLAMLHMYGVVPPVTWRVWVCACLTVAVARDVVLMLSAAGAVAASMRK